MRVAIIGAGVSGLTCANLLRRHCDVHVFEAETVPGGLIRCERLPEGLFHLCGGHVFNSKNEQVLNWFWKLFDKERDFVKAKRNSAIAFDGDRFVGYPIENHVYQLPIPIWDSFCSDLDGLDALQAEPATNFADFLKNRFGATLYELYFKPYNTKIWRCDLSNVPLEWLEGKLPMPTAAEMRHANRERIEEDSFVHSAFWYEKVGGSQYIADILAKDVKIHFETPIEEIRVDCSRGVCVAGEWFDQLVFCGNLKSLPRMLVGVDLQGIGLEIDALQSHGTTTAFCEIDPNPYSWVYQPSKRHESHRIICTGNFSPANNAAGKMTATVEFTDSFSDEDIISQLPLMPFHPRFIKSHYSKYTYPVQTVRTRAMISQLKAFLRHYGISLVGRFAEWEYFNMDAAMASAFDAVGLLRFSD